MPAQRPKASSSRSQQKVANPTERLLLLNARRRHRLDHTEAPISSVRSFICSTPGGVIVSITTRSCTTPSGRSSAQRPEASSSRSHQLPRLARAGCLLLNARRRHRLDHPARCRRPRPSPTAQRPEASSSRSPSTESTVESQNTLLNARRRHRLDHGGGPGGRVRRRRRLLNARRRHRLDHRGGMGREGRKNRAAQRPEASSSRSQRLQSALLGTVHLLNARRRHRLDHPEWTGKAVASTPLLNARRRHRLDHNSATIATCHLPEAAQRPEASSSRSLQAAGDFGEVHRLLNARRRHRLDHPIRRGADRRGWRLLNARRRHRLDHSTLLAKKFPLGSCSTPGGVIVSITRASRLLAGRTRSAQRPEASSSRSRCHDSRFPIAKNCSTPGGVIVSITRPRPPTCPPCPLLNARRRHRLDHVRFRDGANGGHYCSTPGGVTVSITIERAGSPL